MIQERLDLLREALPYIQRFKNKTFVVKLSGKVTEEQAHLNGLAEEITLLNQVGIHVAVIHGGGRAYGVRLRAGEQRYDIGNFEAYFEAFVAFALADPKFGPSLKRRLLDLLNVSHA